MNKHHILVVDDDPDLLRIIKRTLELEGFKVSTAANGESALPLFAEGQPDLVVLDIMMPGMDGYQLLQLIRERSNIPVIMLSAVREADFVQRASGLGADDYVVKPFHTRELLARIRTKLEQVE